MKYIEKTSLFHLHNINYSALEEKINKSKKDITLNFDKLQSLLKLIQEESMIVNKFEFPITLVINVSAGMIPYITITLEQKEKPIIIFPHLMSAYKDLTFNLSLNDFNQPSMTPTIMIGNLVLSSMSLGKDTVSCGSCSRYLIDVLKKFDDFLNFDGNIYQLVYNHGLYTNETKMSYENFNIIFSTSRVKIESKSKYKGGYFESYLTIDADILAGVSVNDIKIKLDIYKQKIALSYKEFMEASLDDLTTALVSIVRLKNVNINNMDSLKFELALQDMINI